MRESSEAGNIALRETHKQDDGSGKSCRKETYFIGCNPLFDHSIPFPRQACYTLQDTVPWTPVWERQYVESGPIL